MFNKLVLDCFNSLDIPMIFDKACNILEVSTEAFNMNITENSQNLRAFGAHLDGDISISALYIASTFNNLLLNNMPIENRSQFICYFVEAVLVHEIHHAYMYFHETEKYRELKLLEIPDIAHPLEIEADKFMINYMQRYFGEAGIKVAQISKSYRSLPAGERRTDEVNRLAKEYLDIIN